MKDWTNREQALAYFERILKYVKAGGSNDAELYQEAVNALRRSQDHTAIQDRLKDVRIERDALRAEVARHKHDLDALDRDYEELRKVIDGGSESMTHADAVVALKSQEGETGRLRELLNLYNLGGWTDSERLMKERDALRAEVAALKREVELLRYYGNKDCTNMADAAMKGGGE